MIEPLFGSAAPVWTAMPPTGFAFQTPMTAANSAALFGPPAVSSLAGSGPAAGQPVAFSVPPYSYGMGTLGLAPQVPPLVGFTPASLLTAISLRRGQPQGPTNDQEVEEFLYEALDLLAGAGDVEVRVEAGRVTLTGTVQQKRVKRDVGEIAWAIPGVQDVQNNVTITSRRRGRGHARESEGPQSVPARKQS